MPTKTKGSGRPATSPAESSPANPTTTSNTPAPSPSDWFLLHARMLDMYDPPIWRQLLVPPTITVDQLRSLMTAAFGWANCHSHMWAIRTITEVDGHSEPMISELNAEGFKIPMAKMGPMYANQPPDWEPIDDDGMPNHGLPPDTTLGELEAKWDLSHHKHMIHWEYDMGDSWEHVIMVEKMIPEADVLGGGAAERLGKPKGKKRSSTGNEKEHQTLRDQAIAKVTGGSGHGVAEDAGSYPGWDDIKEAYKVKGTKKDDEEFAERRDWYENVCANGDPKGLKGKKRLEHFDVQEANQMYEMMLGGFM